MESAGRRKLINSRCFYIFLLPNIIRWNQTEFLMVWSGLEQYQTRKKVLLINFRKLLNKSFEMNFDEPLNKRKSNWNTFYTPYTSHSLRIQTRHFPATIKINWTNPAWYIAWRDCANFSLCHTTCFAGSISWNQN